MLPALKLLSVSSLSLSIVMISLSYPSNSCALILFHISRSLFFLISLICAWILIWKNVGRWSLSMSMVSSTLWFFISTSDSAIVQSISVQLVWSVSLLLLFFICRMHVHSFQLLCSFNPRLVHRFYRRLPPWSDSLVQQNPLMCELKSPTMVVCLPLFLALSIISDMPSQQREMWSESADEIGRYTTQIHCWLISIPTHLPSSKN